MVNWVVAPEPANEAQRLAALKNYQVLDTSAEEAFDRITRLASVLLRTPVALISLVDAQRQWFKSRHGMDAAETSRDLAFCAHAILEDDLLVVPNAKEDVRFSNNPLVSDSPDIRFYAGAPMKTPEGFNIGTLCVIDTKAHYDFSEKDRAILSDLAAIAIDELELRNSLRQEKLSNQAKRDFLANLSHEIRTPMNGILGLSYLLQGLPMSETQYEYVHTINHTAKNLQLLLNDILDFSKIEAGELVLEQAVFDIRLSVSNAVSLFSYLAREKGISLRWSVGEDVPEAINGDPGRTAQILNNLVGNALKFTESGGVNVTLRYQPELSKLLLEVSDSGIGISSEKQRSIFQKFTQGDAAITRKYGGTGLGLTITRQLVGLMGGEVGFDSEPGKGSRFWFTLPVTQLEQSFQQQPANIPCDSTNCIPAAQARLLIAEDHPVNQLFIIRLLQKFGFTNLDVAHNGEEVLVKIKNNAYDAIFMDCRMPVMDGYETTFKIRQNELNTKKHVLILAITANVLDGERERCLISGMDDFISKPIEPDHLLELLSKWFDMRNDLAKLTA